MALPDQKLPEKPAEPRPTHQFPADAFTAEELAVFDKLDPVDPKAAIAWLNGEGPDPWQRKNGSRS